jgi:hypothetical protein
MNTSVKQDQRGIAHLILLVIVALAIGVIGFAGYTVVNKNKTKTNSESSATTDLAKAISNANCEYDDKDLCKFFASWKTHQSFKVTAESTDEGKKSTSLYESEGEDKFHMASTGDFNFEMITIGKTTYTKGGDGTWWKQIAANQEITVDLKAGNDFDFEEPSKDEPAGQKTTYTKIGKEACGKLTCFKYQVIEPGETGKQYIWFDDKDYQMRRMRSEGGEGGTYEGTFSYDSVKISEPSPIKELGPNQYIIPGSNEPQTIQSGIDYQQYMNNSSSDSSQ